jgi:GAF domain-containing protein
MQEPAGGGPDDLNAIIARQAQEIERLRSQLEADRFAAELREALTLGATSATIASPLSHGRLLEMIVQTAAQVINARAAALFTIDEDARELVFEVALGQKADEVRRFRVPLGHGIAGLVAATGQPMAISDAQSDPRHASEIAESVGYHPQSILCVPLSRDGEITGVLELLDKDVAPSFTAADITTLGYFANQAAVAIEQSRVHRNMRALIDEAIHASALSDASKQRLRDRAGAFIAGIEEDPAHRRALELAALIHEITVQGEAETRAVDAILRGFVQYLRTRPRSSDEMGAFL